MIETRIRTWTKHDCVEVEVTLAQNPVPHSLPALPLSAAKRAWLMQHLQSIQRWPALCVFCLIFLLQLLQWEFSSLWASAAISFFQSCDTALPLGHFWPRVFLQKTFCFSFLPTGWGLRLQLSSRVFTDLVLT